MTPLERATAVVRKHVDYWGHKNCAGFIEDVRVAIIEATNDELEKRRAAEKELADSIAVGAQYKSLLHGIYVSWRREGNWCIPGDVQEQILQMFHKVPRGDDA